MRLVGLSTLALLLTGCGQAPPALSGGKPVSYWVQALKDSDPALRKKAAFKLGNAGPADAAVVPALLAALKDEDAGVRSAGILALVKFGPDAREAIPTLAAMEQDDSDDQVRDYAAKARIRIKEQAR
jgi:HEAT repeat protein